MDLHELWQENKRWIVGCLAGLILYWIGTGVIGSVYDPKSLTRKISASKRKIQEEQYRQPQETAARDDQKKLAEVFDTLRRSLHFQPTEAFLLEGKGDPQLHWNQMYSQVRDQVLDAGRDANVDFSEDALAWPTPSDREAIERALICLNLVDQAVGHLLSAHQEVTRQDFEALGLRSIDDFKLSRQSSRRYQRRRASGKDEKNPADYIDEYRVQISFHADCRTVHLFLERFRQSSQPITLEGLKIEQGRKPGDPLEVRGDMVAVSIKVLEEEEGG